MTDTGQNGHNPGRPPASRIRLVVSDMDGTILTPEKQVTRESIAAIQTLKKAGVPVCFVSSRPPGGMEMYFDALGVHTPYGALNGGTIFNADRTIRSRLSLDPEAVQDTLLMLKVHQIDAWLFRGHEWLVTNATGAYVEPEARAIRMTPTAVPSFNDYQQEVGKVTGASADYEALERQELEIGQLLQGRASVARSCKCFLDITPLNANKGYALRQLASFYNIPIEEVACIGDMNNDVPMLSIGGLSIAMGQAKPDVAAQAHFITASNSENGWAKAMEQFVLPRVAPLSNTAGKTVS